MPNSSPWRLGVDVGGTFTDAVLYHDITGHIISAKVCMTMLFTLLCLKNRNLQVPSTPPDQSKGVLNAIDQLK